MSETNDDFPHREEAMEMYRHLWLRFLIEGGYHGKQASVLTRAMDTEQSRISRGPDATWQAFADSLPGYRAWWDGQRTEALAQIEAVTQTLTPRTCGWCAHFGGRSGAYRCGAGLVAMPWFAAFLDPVTGILNCVAENCPGFVRMPPRSPNAR